MTKTKTELVAEAHRRIRVLSVDEDPSDDQATYGAAAADSLFEELKASPFNMPWTWDIDEIPEATFRPFAWVLATDLAVHYIVASESRMAALARLRAHAFPDDRTDRRDTDEDGLISDEEAEAGDRALFY